MSNQILTPQDISIVPAVIIKRSKAITTSLEIARVFEKLHKHVIRDIEALGISENFRRSNFGLSSYVNSQNKEQKMYEMSKDGFTFLALGYTGAKADKFKEWYITEFNRMETFILNKKNQEWVETRKAGKLIRNTETDAVKLFIDYATKQGSSNAKFYYANISKMQNKALFLLDQKYKNVRELLDVEQLWTIASADKIVIKALKDGMNREMNYKDIYQLAKTNVETFAAIHGKSAIPDTKLRLVG